MTTTSGAPTLRWFRQLGELVLPRSCAGCGADATWWCARCAGALRADPLPVPALAPVRGYAVAPYRGCVGAALVAMKERGAVALVGPMSAALARAVRACAPTVATPLVLVPAPSRASAVRARGLDVLAVLARATAARLRSDGVDAVAVPCLAHGRRVADQTSLDPAARAANLDGALVVRRAGRPLVAGRAVVVVDDVVTTGATVTEAVRVLRRLRADVVGAAALACAGGTSEGDSGDRVVPPPGGG